MTELAFLTATELSRRLRRGELSAVALLDHLVARIERHDTTLNAVVVRHIAHARNRAAEADAALARGERWGPLHGLPMTVKEAFDGPGLPTTGGLEAFRGNVATGHSVATQRLEAAGAIVFGKTNVPSALADWQS
ncbi:MAG: amidase family protein, partial [Rubrivivax sp.]